MEVNQAKPGMILVSNSQWGRTYVKVIQLVCGRFGDYLACEVLNSDRSGETESVHHIGEETMRGTGWKIPTADELSRLEIYATA